MSRPHRNSAIGARSQHLRNAQEGKWKGAKQGERKGGRSFEHIWIVCRIQMSRVLVTDHLTGNLTGLRGCPAMPRVPPHSHVAETVALSVVGLSGQAVHYRSLYTRNTHSHGERCRCSGSLAHCTCWFGYVTCFTLPYYHHTDYRSAPGELLPLDVN